MDDNSLINLDKCELLNKLLIYCGV